MDKTFLAVVLLLFAVVVTTFVKHHLETPCEGVQCEKITFETALTP